MRVVLAEGLAPLRSGVTRLLTAYGFDVPAAVGTAPELRDALIQHQPTVVVADVRLPPGGTEEGLASVLAARREHPRLPVLLLSHQLERLHVRELLADGDGAIGYLLKSRVAEDDLFVEAIRRVAAGGVAMDPKAVALLATERELPDTLTPSERDVLSLLAEGRSYAAIAQRLFLSASAVVKNSVSLFGKLGLEPAQDENVRALAALGYLTGTGRHVPH